MRLSGTKTGGCRRPSRARSRGSPRNVAPSSARAATTPTTSWSPPRTTGKRECSDASSRRKFSSVGTKRSRTTTSPRGTIKDPIWRSSRRNTLRTMACSWASIAPDSEPSASSASISSCVTAGIPRAFTPNNPRTNSVDPVNRRPNGRVAAASQSMGRATARAIGSG